MSRGDESGKRVWWILGGCLGGCLLVLLLIGGCVGLIGGGLFFGMRSSDAYQQALAAAQSDPRLIEALGEPIESGWLVSGSISVNGATGDADLAIPIEGPKGKAKLYVEATKSAGSWEFLRLEAVVEETGEHIELQPPSAGGELL